MENLNWRQVVLFLGMIGLFVIGVVVLVAMGKSVSDLLLVMTALAVPIAIAGGAHFIGTANQKISNVEHNTNGNMTRLLNMLESQMQAQPNTKPAEVVAVEEPTHNIVSTYQLP